MDMKNAYKHLYYLSLYLKCSLILHWNKTQCGTNENGIFTALYCQYLLIEPIRDMAK